jgi:hypothetical protein
MPRAITRQLATFDIETDPFQNGRIPKPYSVGVYDGESYWSAWGDDCMGQFIEYLATRKPLLLYAHNGGRFDFYYLLSELQNPMRVINGRIVSAALGVHRVRDSFAILPVPLRAGGEKMLIDYAHMERGQREAHKAQISAYLKQDCIALYNLVEPFRQTFGDKLTIGSAAITELQALHPFPRLGQSHDEKFRPYYFGGRVEAIKKGVHNGRWQVLDVNSMYPYVMKRYQHPLGDTYLAPVTLSRALIKSSAPFFATIDATSKGAFPFRSEDQSIPLTYPHCRGRFWVSGHELRAALSLGLTEIHNVSECYVATQAQTFGAFVDKFVARKLDAEKRGDTSGRLFAKLVLNSAYGKFGSNPENYKDHLIYHDGDEWPMPAYPTPGKDWEPESIIAPDELIIFARAARNAFDSYYDVATAASITGAARAVLLRALHAVSGPIYCDTDSIICKGPGNLPLHASKLGAWKLEATGNRLAIGGKKLYALFNSKGVCVKDACKGVTLTPAEILDISQGSTIISRRDAPTYSLMRPHGAFVDRTIKGAIR